MSFKILNLPADVYIDVLITPVVLATATPTYRLVADYQKATFLLILGACDGNVDLAVKQATASGGTGAKVVTDAVDGVTTGSITQLTASSDNKYVAVTVDISNLDDGFNYLSATLTVAGVATEGTLILFLYGAGDSPVTQPAAFAQTVHIRG